MSRRVWKEAVCVPDPPGFAVCLDGKPVRLPSGAKLHLSTAALAEAVAAEWRAAPDPFTPADLPMTGLAGSAQERVRPNEAAMVAALAAYAEADLLCYRCEHPAALAALQDAEWQPWLDWAASTHLAVLHVTTGIQHLAQPPASLAALARALARLNAEELAALGVVIPAFGSCVLGLALAEGAITADQALAVATLDERFQHMRWGEDRQAAEREALLRAEIDAAARFMGLSRATG